MSKTGKSRLSRLLPKFLRGDKSSKSEGGIDSKSPYCIIHFLDDSHHQIQIKANWKGNQLLEKVCELLSLHEKDYFGLRFIDSSGQTHWLDGSKSLSSQLKGCQTPHKLYFGVKFYAADPCKLREEITRYLFYLQVKQDVLQGRLPVTFDEATELSAYAVQSELGDYDHHQHTVGYVSEFCFIPNQTEELERRVAAIHSRLVGMVPVKAEYRYLEKVKWLDMYGVDLHPVLGEGNVEYFLGLTPTGIVVYKNKNKVGNYFWPRINKVTFKGKFFIVKVKDKNNEEHVYAFELPRKTATKHLWKCCVEHHAFFSGRSERQAVSDGLSRHSANVVRLPSRRQPRRINSDSRLNADENYNSQYNHDTGMVTMMMRPEPVRAPRHRSLPELQGHESPRSTKSAPWETNFDYGLYTHGRESPQSERSNKMREQRSRVMVNSDSESGVSQRRKYFPNRRGSDNDSDVSVTRRRRRDIDSDSASDVSSRYPASHGNKSSAFPLLYPFHDKENRPNGSIPSLHSAPAGEAKQRRRRRRSKSPGKHPPNELKSYIDFDLRDTNGMSTEELKEIPFVNVQTKASLFKLKYSPKLRQKVKAAKQKSLGQLDQNRNQVMKRQTSAPAQDEADRDMSVHSQPIMRKGEEDVDSSAGYNQREVGGNSKASRRPHSYHQSQISRSDYNTFPRTSNQPLSEHSNTHQQKSDSILNQDFHGNAEPSANNHVSNVPSEHSHHQSSNNPHSRPADARNSRMQYESPGQSQTSRSNHDSHAVTSRPRSHYDKSTVPQNVRSPYDTMPQQNSRQTHDISSSRSPYDLSSAHQSSRPSNDKSKSYHSDYEAPRSGYAASTSSHRSHRSRHRDNVSHAHPAHSRSQQQATYDSDANNTMGRRRDQRQDHNNEYSQSNDYRNSSVHTHSQIPGQENYSRSDRDRTGPETERFQQQTSDSRIGRPASRSGHRGEGHPNPASYHYREGSQPAHYASPPSASDAAPPPYHHGNVSYSSFTSPPQNFRQQQQHLPPQKSNSTLSPYDTQPSQNYHNVSNPYDSVASRGHHDQRNRPRSYGQDEEQRPRSQQYEGHRPGGDEGQRSRHRGEGNRSRSSLHEERPSRAPRLSYQGDVQHSQYDQQNTSGYPNNTPSYQPSPKQFHHQPPSQQHYSSTPPRYQGTQPMQQGTPPRHQGTPSRHSVSSTPPKQHGDPRYSQGLLSVHAREQSEGSSSQASVLVGGNYHRSPRPSPALSGPDQVRQLLRSSTHNPDLCTEL